MIHCVSHPIQHHSLDKTLNTNHRLKWTLAHMLPCLVITLSLVQQSDLSAMNHNLYTAWNDGCSRPASKDMVFYSHESDNLLFDTVSEIKIICQATVRGVSLKWTISRNMLHTPFAEGVAEALPGNRFVIKIDTGKLHPGFYDLHVTLDSGMAEPYKAICTFGYRCDEMAINATEPKDFVTFWDKAVASLKQIPLDAKHSEMQTFDKKAIEQYNTEHACLPADYDPKGHVFETVESCKVNFAGPDDGGRVYGYLAKPVGDGPFPAMLVLPGAGFNRRPRPLEHARHGYVALDIQVHGQDVDLEGKYPTVEGYNDKTNTDPFKHYYYNVHLRCVQAINYLCSRPDVDPSRIVIVGGSQGGRLGIVTAGIDHRVTAVVSCIANSPNIPHINWAKACNAKRIDGMSATGAPPLAGSDREVCEAYFDPMNYALHIQCPVLMNAGLIDPVSPPSSVFAVYNKLNPKIRKMIAIPGVGHDWSAAFDMQAWDWIKQVHTRNQ